MNSNNFESNSNSSIKNNYGSIATTSFVNARTSTRQPQHSTESSTYSNNTAMSRTRPLDDEHEPTNNSISISTSYSLLPLSPSSSLVVAPTDGNGVVNNELHLSVSNNINNDEYTNMSSKDATTTTTKPVSKAKKLWNKLAGHVNDGEYLLPSSTTDNSDDVENNESGGNFFHRSFRRSFSSNINNNNNNNVGSNDTVSRRERAVASIQNALQFTLGQCIVAIIIYLGIAVLAFSFVLEHWTIIDSMYFAVVTFTTIGYGDIAPDNAAGRLFTCFFAVSGVACLGIALGVVGTNLMESHNAAIEQADHISKEQTISMFAAAAADEDCPINNHNNNNDPFANNNNNNNNNINQECPTTTTIHESTKVTETDTTALTGLYRIGFEFVIVLLILLIFAICLIIVDPGIEIDDALYFTIVTATTVGYGDYAPKSQIGRFVSIIFIPITVGAMGHWLSVVASYIMDHRQSSFQQRLNTSNITIQDLEIMDSNNDGDVTFIEFLEFMLRIMNKVDTTTFNELRCLFNKLDHDGTGTLSKHDLIVMAKNKLHKNPIRKLQLAAYKHKLLSSIHSSDNIIIIKKDDPTTTTTTTTINTSTGSTTTIDEQQKTR